MRMIPTVRRAHTAPTAYAVGGGLHGMIAETVEDVSPRIARRAENLVRRADGALTKRPGLRYDRSAGVSGQVEWEYGFAGATLVLYVNEGEYAVRHSALGTRQIGAAPPLRVRFGEKLLLLCEGEWLIFSPDGTVMSLTDGGYTDIHNDFPSPVEYRWEIRQCILTVPLLRAGSSPSGGGELVDPPNMLCPHVRESFTYSAQDRDARRNRFEMLLVPVMRGEMPVDGEGSISGLTPEQRQTRADTMNDSAMLEVRITSTDGEGNPVTRWQTVSFTAADNFNGRAVWLNGIHERPLAFDGGDNIRITYFRDLTQAQADFFKLTACRVGTLFGVNGFKDRLFISGSGEEPGRIRYSGMDDMFYFGTIRYITVGGGTPVRQLAGQDVRMTVFGEDTAFTVTGRAEEETGTGYRPDALFTVPVKADRSSAAGRSSISAAAAYAPSPTARRSTGEGRRSAPGGWTAR